MVRLKVYYGGNFVAIVFQFQFHYGTIKSGYLYDATNITINFNSTMVRLKAGVDKVRITRVIFQFHYGTIKSLHTRMNI